jgi:hypothetical protein
LGVAEYTKLAGQKPNITHKRIVSIAFFVDCLLKSPANFLGNASAMRPRARLNVPA